MGCDIHIHAEHKDKSGKYIIIKKLSPFYNRDYGVFGFLAGVRNYSAITPIAERRGIPDNASSEVLKDYEVWGCDAHSASWLSTEELINFNYDAEMKDCRVTRQTGPRSWDGGCTCDKGEGIKTTYREFLGKYFFEDLEELKKAKVERIVFWFDN